MPLVMEVPTTCQVSARVIPKAHGARGYLQSDSNRNARQHNER